LVGGDKKFYFNKGVYMLRILLVFLVLFQFSCGSHNSQTTQSMSALQQAENKAVFYKQGISDAIFASDRCDELAFRPYLTIAGITQDLSPWENNGRWYRNRSSDAPCYPNYSPGTISFDGLIAVFHHIWTVKDKDMLNRYIAYSSAHYWVVGDGLYSNQILTYPIVTHMVAKMGLINIPSLDDILQSYKGHLLASYIYLEGRMNGKLDEAEYQAAESLFNSNNQDPMYSALWHRFSDGIQDDTLTLLLNRPEFPATIIPTDAGVFNWGGEPAIVAYLLALSIVEGK
jgi:hypothetical protein